MAVASGVFKKLATKLVTDTFGGFQKTLVMRTPVYPTPLNSDPTYTEETGKAIPLSLDFKMFESQMIEIGDFQLVTNASQWTTDPDINGLELVFDGKTLTVIQVEKDADNAAYFIKVRKK